MNNLKRITPYCGGRIYTSGFTLAEVLITLGIIGVVAAITLPSLITNINERVNSERHANIVNKVTKAMENMRANGALVGNYSSTEEFVNELQKYLKIAKRCDNNHLSECWPTEKVTTSKGEIFDVNNAKTRRDLINGTGGEDTDNVGLILADGGAIILTYDTSSTGFDIGDAISSSNKSLPVGFGKNKDFPYTSSATASIDFVMEVNGSKGANSETINNKYHDIRSFKVAKFSKGCAGLDVDGVGCIVILGSSFECINETPYAKNCWAGAKKACSDIGMSLPSQSDCTKIYSKKKNYSELSQLNDKFWEVEEMSKNSAYLCNFSKGYTNGHDYKKDTVYKTMCIGN